jgi:predicted RNA-binding protein YlxR (DUF448 family)
MRRPLREKSLPGRMKAAKRRLSRRASALERAVMGKGRGHRPIRTCVSCGAKKEKSELTRLALDETGAWREGPGSGRGKGRYVCKTEACQERATKNRRWHRVSRSMKPDRA